MALYGRKKLTSPPEKQRHPAQKRDRRQKYGSSAANSPSAQKYPPSAQRKWAFAPKNRFYGGHRE
ncbi:MAG: hypothetical protein H6633_04400 [Anaerolineales bacterium]|nr:hypothetical protein [Anaerolineales bacterium]